MNTIKAEDWIGKNIAEYKILMEAGRGQTGVVFLAEHTVEKHYAAIKIFPAGNTADAALKSAQIVKRLSHPGIAAILDYGDIENCVYVVAEYVSYKKETNGNDYSAGKLFSKNLSEYIEEQSGLVPEKTVINILSQIIDALEYLFGIHNPSETSLYCGGINPNRILVTKDEYGGIIIKITDIGVPVIRGSSSDIDAFLSPEELQGEMANERSHVYSLGAIAYNLITGTAPPSPVIPPSKIRSDISVGWNEIIRNSLAFETEKRYSDCQVFRNALLHIKSLVPKKVTFNALKAAIVSFAFLIALILIYALGAKLLSHDAGVSKKLENLVGKIYKPSLDNAIPYDTKKTVEEAVPEIKDNIKPTKPLEAKTKITDDVEEILDMSKSVAVTEIPGISSKEKTEVELPGGVPAAKTIADKKSVSVEEIPGKTKVKYTEYTVKKNDSLWGISWKHYMKVKELIFINGLSENAIIQPGQKLKVKKGKTREMPKRKAKPAAKTNAVVEAEEKMGGMRKIGDMGKTNVVTNIVALTEYTVKKGDTYYSLSKKFNCTVKELEEINDNKKLITGMKMKVNR